LHDNGTSEEQYNEVEKSDSKMIVHKVVAVFSPLIIGSTEFYSHGFHLVAQMCHFVSKEAVIAKSQPCPIGSESERKLRPISDWTIVTKLALSALIMRCAEGVGCREDAGEENELL
jgi:hypothetical protein